MKVKVMPCIFNFDPLPSRSEHSTSNYAKALMTINYWDRDLTVTPRRGQIENAQKNLD